MVRRMIVMILKAIILGIVEGLTEFLPVSSTGHLILVNKYLSLGDFENVFNVVIQAGAILAVILFFWHKIWPGLPFQRGYNLRNANKVFRLWKKVVVGFLPAAVLGFLFDDYIDEHFFNPKTVGIALIVGAILLLVTERRLRYVRVDDTDDLTYKDAIVVGFSQCLALWPGMSRSASTIIGGLYMGQSREVAAEYSFFLSIPTIIGASVLKLYKSGFSFTSEEWTLLGVGFITSFIVALLVIAFFMNYIRRRKLAPFAYYRIILGAIVLLSL